MSPLLLGILNSQAAGAAAGAYDLLETQQLSSSAASVTFTGLGSYSDYKHLQLRMSARLDNSTASGTRTASIRFNNDTGSNYAYSHVYSGGSSTTGNANFNVSDIPLESWIPNGLTDSNVYAPAVVDILDFSNSSRNTTTRALYGVTIETEDLIFQSSGLWNNTAAVTSISISSSSNLKSDTRISLFGIKGS